MQPEPTNGGEMHPKLELESVRQKKQRDSEAQSLPVSGDWRDVPSDHIRGGHPPF